MWSKHKAKHIIIISLYWIIEKYIKQNYKKIHESGHPVPYMQDSLQKGIDWEKGKERGIKTFTPLLFPEKYFNVCSLSLLWQVQPKSNRDKTPIKSKRIDQNPRPRPLPLPRPPPRPLPPPPLPPRPRSASFLALFLGLGVSSTSNVSSGRLSGRM